MFDPEPYLRRTFTTSSAIAADAWGCFALGSSERVYKQNDARREGLVKAYAPDRGWEMHLQQSVDSPKSLKGWNDEDAAFERAIFERDGSERLTVGGFIAAARKNREIVVPDGGEPSSEETASAIRIGAGISGEAMIETGSRPLPPYVAGPLVHPIQLATPEE